MSSPTQDGDDKLAAQRRELDTMSDALVANLQAMIDEQTQRSQELASHQHSLSAQARVPVPQRDLTRAPGLGQPKPPKKTATKAPHLPPPPRVHEEASVELSPTLTQMEEQASSETPPTPWYGKQVLKKKPDEEKNNSVVSTIIFIIVAFILLRCMS